MSEVHRILMPGGIFISCTPCFPSAKVFGDPTHVNYLSTETIKYFCDEEPWAQRYGFKGKFDRLLDKKIYPTNYEKNILNEFKYIVNKLKFGSTYLFSIWRKTL